MTTAKTVIKSLQATYANNEEILIAWWDKNWFEEMLDRKITDDEWSEVLNSCEKVIEYTDLGDQLMMEAERALEELTKENAEHSTKG